MLDETVQQEMVQQINSVISDADGHEDMYLVTRAKAVIERLTRVGSTYMKMAAEATSQGFTDGARRDHLENVLVALRDDIAHGYLKTFEELVHASLFADILGQAEELLNHEYKDPAAVLVGGALEIHLRELAKKNGIAVEQENRKGKAMPRKVEDLTNDLTRENVYSKHVNRQVKGWYGLRTDAAHGNYAEYNADEIKEMLKGVKDFMEKHPA